jgi:hypothetical protein
VIFTIAMKKPFEVVPFATQAAIWPNEIHFRRCYNANNNRNANINDNYSYTDAIEVSVRGVDGQREAREYDVNRGEATNALKGLIYTGRVASYQAKSEDEMQAVADALSQTRVLISYGVG